MWDGSLSPPAGPRFFLVQEAAELRSAGRVGDPSPHGPVPACITIEEKQREERNEESLRWESAPQHYRV